MGVEEMKLTRFSVGVAELGYSATRMGHHTLIGNCFSQPP